MKSSSQEQISVFSRPLSDPITSFMGLLFPGKICYTILHGQSAAGPGNRRPHPDTGGICRTRSVQTLHRILHRQHPQPQHQGRLRSGGCRLLPLVRAAGPARARPPRAGACGRLRRASGKNHAAPSVKQHLAAVRMLFDWLVVGQVVRSTPPPWCGAPATSSSAAGRRTNYSHRNNKNDNSVNWILTKRSII